jgi:FPC/CPF motif-containing protein YcgG
MLWVLGEYAPMNSVASHSGRHATARNNPLTVCPHFAQPQRLIRVDPASPNNAIGDLFSNYVLDGSHPCVMARSMVNRKQVFLASYGELGEVDRCAEVCHDLYEVLAASGADSSLYSLVAVFSSQANHTENAFERALWDQLNGMHQVDRTLFSWDSCVSQDPTDPEFSFSVGGAAWYVVGLHPGASRSSRQFAVPALIFNRHAQFVALREQGRYDQMRDRIRERDVQLQGSVNPMLKDHGDASEAIQYSGRAVDTEWGCPFVQRQLS